MKLKKLIALALIWAIELAPVQAWATPAQQMLLAGGAGLDPNYMWSCNSLNFTNLGGSAGTCGAAGTGTITGNGQFLNCPTTGGADCQTASTGFTAISGKKYAEFKVVSSVVNYLLFGVTESPNAGWITPSANSWSFWRGFGGCGVTGGSTGGYYAGSTRNASATYQFASGDIIGIAIDTATRKIWMRKNGTWVGGGDPGAGTGQDGTITGSGALYFMTAVYQCIESNGSKTITIYPSAGTQTYALPSGYSAYAP